MSNLERLTAALANRYVIERELGAGGMATVYLAADRKHQRRVAIKVLLPELAASLGHERFLREITTTANLRHPHILPLYDSGEAGGFLYYVMPLVEGESLRDRLDREKQLPLADALGIAREVADALSYAHSRGIVHRDIKPENILLESGHAVVADFGIARAVTAAGGEKLTGTGMAVGTPQYMSPEQAAGEKDLDGRSDLYSLGCVLYEMLAGQPPFTGPTVESVIHQHLMAIPPPVTQLRPSVPADVVAALQRALAKAPADRFNPVAQFAEALVPGPAAAAPGRRAPLSRVMVGSGVAAVLAAVAIIVLLARGSGGGPDVTIGRTMQVTREPGLEVDPALSPDGATIAYAAGPTNAMQIYVRQVSGGRPVALTNDTTDNFRWPRWSPDGTRIAYQSNDGISVVPALGGPARLVVRVDSSAYTIWAAPISGFDWSPDGARIAWTTGYHDSLLRVVALAGGATVTLKTPGEAYEPAWSPDGRHIALAVGNPAFVFGTAYFGNIGATAIWVVSADGSGATRVSTDSGLNVSPQWSPDGRALYWVSNRDGSRDIYRQRLRGGTAAVGAPRRLTTGADAQGLSLSRSGARLAYSRLNLWSAIWSIPVPARGPVSIRGARRITTGNETIEDVDVSPDGRWLVFDSDRAGNADLYVMPAAGGEARQLTTDPAGDFSGDWSPDGHRIVFHSLRNGSRDIYTVESDGTGLHRWTSGLEQKLDPDWAPDNETVVFEVFGSQHGFGILRLADGTHPRFIQTPLGDFAHWAPRGRTIVYHGADGLRVRQVDTESDTLVTSNAADRAQAFYPAWAPDAKQIYYMARSVTGWTIRAVPANGDPSRVLVTFDDPTRQQTKYGFCTDGRLFYLTLGSPESDLYVADMQRP